MTHDEDHPANTGDCAGTTLDLGILNPDLDNDANGAFLERFTSEGEEGYILMLDVHSVLEPSELEAAAVQFEHLADWLRRTAADPDWLFKVAEPWSLFFRSAGESQ